MRSTLILVSLVTVGSVLAGAPLRQVPPAQIAVSPSRFELSIGSQATTESLSLFNYGDDPVEIRVSVANWDLDENNSVRILRPTEQSLDQWLVINPLRFSIPPNKSQTVRFSIRPRVRPEPGEHRAMIYFDQVLPEESPRALQIRFRVGVAVYGHAGEVTRIGKLNSIQVSPANPVQVRFDISNVGSSNVRIVGEFAVWRADRYPGFERTKAIAAPRIDEDSLPDGVLVAGRIPSRPVLPGTRRELTLQISQRLPPGGYVLDLNGEMHGVAIDRGIPFTIPYPAQVKGAVSD